jgi:hypothetical protein
MYDEKLNWNKVRLRQRKIPRLRISCARLKTTRIHDSKLQTKAGVWSNLVFNSESKAKFITCGKIWYGSYSGGGEQNVPTQTPRSQNFPKFSPATQWHNYAHFWYSKVDLDWIRICSKNYICRGNTALKNSRTETH